ncbi:MAG: transposase, partial [Candidatus Brocadiaceae bacterium]|nr:transposase [Candidatus Brocadiaceae bacterium]
EWLPEAHLARYVAAVVENIDLSMIERAYAGRGSDAYHPAMLLGLLIYGYATGTFSSRKIERATYDSLAFRYLACNRHPDHDTLANFRRRFGNQFESAFVQVLQVAHENQLSRFGTVSLDGTKIHANASRHSALSYEHAVKLEAQLKTEVQELFALAEAADQTAVPDGMSVPAEIARREDQIKAITEARTQIEARARERYAREKAEFDLKMAARQAKEAETGRKPGGKKPTPPTDTPRPEDQINLTDDESRIMKVSGGGFEQCYNAQAVVDTESMLVIAPFVTQAANDKQQIQPALDKIAALPGGMNAPEALLADTGYFSEHNVDACIGAEVEPLISVGRDAHHPDWKERFSEPSPLPANATPVEKMKHTLKTRAGKAIYGLRKQTVEPVFGIIKSVMGFRQFMLRGLEQVGHEWTLVCLAWNLKRMAVLRQNSV